MRHLLFPSSALNGKVSPKCVTMKNVVTARKIGIDIAKKEKGRILKTHLVLAVTVATSRTTSHLVGFCWCCPWLVMCLRQDESDGGDSDCLLLRLRTTLISKQVLGKSEWCISLKLRGFRAQRETGVVL